MTSVLPPSATPATGSQAAPQAGTSPAASDGRRTRYALIFAIVSGSLTLLAVVLAVLAPLFSSVSDPLSDGWHKVYDSASQPLSAASWDVSKGCDVRDGGLHASSQAECTYKPSLTSDLTSKGFVVEATVAPPDAVASEQRPAIYISDDVFVGIDQSGSYALCAYTCDTSNPGGTNGIAVFGQAGGWHAATDVSNTIAVRVIISEQTNTLQFFTNGQYAASIDLPSISLLDIGIALGADSDGEALFTSAAIYSASA